MLRVTHNAGFFSCCQVRLEAIVGYYNEKGRLPIYIDSSEQYALYSNGKKNIIEQFFQNKDITIPSGPLTWGPWLGEPQFANLHTIRYDHISPLVNRYFSPTPEIMRRVNFLKTKYNIHPAETCVLFYRGTDKVREVGVPSYTDVYQRANSKRIWLQSDESEFLRLGKINFPNACIMEDEIRHTREAKTVDILNTSTNQEYAKWFLAIVLLMSECETVVCGTGNINLWIALFRGHSRGIQQYRCLLPKVYGITQRPAETNTIWCEHA